MSSEILREQKIDLGFKDFGYAGLWDKRDSEKIEKTLEKIRLAAAINDDATADKLLNDFNERLERKYQDQTVRPHQRWGEFEPLEVGYKDDMAQKLGIHYLLKLVTMQQTVRFSYFMIGTSAVAETPFQNDLFNETIRVSLDTSGAQHAAGSALRYIGFFNDAVESNTYREGAVVDKATDAGQTLLFRSVYDTPIVHTVSVTSVTLSQTLQFVEIQ